MKNLSLPLFALLLSTTSGAFAATTSPNLLSVRPMPSRSVTFEATTGPVTVNSGPAITLPNAADYRVSIADLDSNGDGRLTRGEVPAGHALASEFKLVDRNRDGRITAAELKNWR